MTDLRALVAEAEQEWLERWRQGPTRLRWTQLPPQIGGPAPDLELADMDGNQVRLSSFWQDGPALFIFWRHYGCGCGVDRAARLQREQPLYEAAGARVVVIGQGEPERAKAYAERFGLRCTVLCDPIFQAYDAYGLLEGTTAQILYDAGEELLRADHEAGLRFAEARRGIGRPLVDNPWQMPGEFVVDPAGRIALAYRYQYCEDFPDPRVLDAAIRSARGT